jgi:hypothetical protein
MSSTRDPVRLIDHGSGAAPDLAEALRFIQAEEGSVEQALALQHRLAAQLGPAAGLGSTGGAFGALFSWSRLLLVGIALSGLALWTLSPWGRPALRGTSMTRSSSATAAVAREPQPKPPTPSDALARPRDIVATPLRVTRPRRPHTTRVLAQASPSAAPDPDPDAELALLQRAQAALGEQPAQALELAERHAGMYPDGVFVQEREMIAIGALLKLHHRPEAIARAELFVQRHADSPHALRVRNLLEHIPDRSAAASPAAP